METKGPVPIPSASARPKGLSPFPATTLLGDEVIKSVPIVRPDGHEGQFAMPLYLAKVGTDWLIVH